MEFSERRYVFVNLRLNECIIGRIIMCGASRFGRPGEWSNGLQSGLLLGRNRRDISKRTGFTLIELLVVISIIALLMAILLPTLQRVKRQAKAVVCQSNLHQWGLCFEMYTDDNDGRFSNNGKDKYYWYRILSPYYSDSNDLLSGNTWDCTHDGNILAVINIR